MTLAVTPAAFTDTVADPARCCAVAIPLPETVRTDERLLLQRNPDSGSSDPVRSKAWTENWTASPGRRVALDGETTSRTELDVAVWGVAGVTPRRLTVRNTEMSHEQPERSNRRVAEEHLAAGLGSVGFSFWFGCLPRLRITN